MDFESKIDLDRILKGHGIDWDFDNDPSENEPVKAPAKKKKSRFGDMLFGSNYDITKD